MKLKFLGQNCFLLNFNGKNILTDPFYNIGKDKSGFDISAQPIDYILITHAHGDHVADVEEVLKFHPQAKILSQPEICAHYKDAESVDFNIGGSVDLDGLKIWMVHADHTSSFPDGSYGGVASGFILRYEEKNLYLSGDTGVFSGMELFSKLYGNIDTAILCVGGHYTMCARQAAIAAQDLLKAGTVIGCHFDTFPPITIDHTWAKAQFSERNIDFKLPEKGEEFEV